MKLSITALGILVFTLASSSWAAIGKAQINGTEPNSLIKGTVTLEDSAAGLVVKAQLASVPPGKHGFHIHEFGRCDDMAKAAGGHYNPGNTPHGLITKDGANKAHAGDMGNITADKTGAATLEVTLPGVTLLSGAHSVAGRAIVLHEKADDFGQPVGNAGGRIGCGSILVTSSSDK